MNSGCQTQKRWLNTGRRAVSLVAPGCRSIAVGARPCSLLDAARRLLAAGAGLTFTSMVELLLSAPRLVGDIARLICPAARPAITISARLLSPRRRIRSDGSSRSDRRSLMTSSTACRPPTPRTLKRTAFCAACWSATRRRARCAAAAARAARRSRTTTISRQTRAAARPRRSSRRWRRAPRPR